MFYLVTQIWLHLLLAFALGGVATWWWLVHRSPDAHSAEGTVEPGAPPEASQVKSLRRQLEAARSDARAAREALTARTRELERIRQAVDGAREVPTPEPENGPSADDPPVRRSKPLTPRLPEALVEHADVPPLERDDLTRIRGVGPVLERLLNEMGIYTFREIAHWTPDDVDRVQAHLPRFPGRIRRDDWVGQAAELDRAYDQAIPDV